MVVDLRKHEWAPLLNGAKPLDPKVRLYKAVTPGGMDFRTGTVDYGQALTSEDRLVTHPGNLFHGRGEIVTRRGADPRQMVADMPETYLSVSRLPHRTLLGGAWPCRLLLVRPTGSVLRELVADPFKVACRQLEVLEELPAHLALGPSGELVAQLVRQVEMVIASLVRDHIGVTPTVRDLAERARFLNEDRLRDSWELDEQAEVALLSLHATDESDLITVNRALGSLASTIQHGLSNWLHELGITVSFSTNLTMNCALKHALQFTAATHLVGPERVKSAVDRLADLLGTGSLT